MNTRWTPALLNRVRQCAADGCTMAQAAGQLGVKLNSLEFYAYLHKISFSGNAPRRLAAQQATAPMPDVSVLTPQARALVIARASLAHEIAAAIAERSPSMPVYRGGWPDDD